MPKTGLNPPTFGSFDIKVQVHRMQLVMMGTPATDCNTCKKYHHHGAITNLFHKITASKGAALVTEGPPSKKLKIIMSLNT